MFFGTNLRYGFPALMLGAVLLPGGVVKHKRLCAVAVLITTITTQLDPVAWSIGFHGSGFFKQVPRIDALAGMAAVIILAITVAVSIGYRFTWSRQIPVVVITVLALTGVGLSGVHHRYLQGRCKGESNAAQWIRNTSHADIGLFGQYLMVKYPFYSQDRTNRVQYIAIERFDHSIREPATCSEWVALLARADFEYVVLNAPATGQGPVQWTEQIPGAEQVLQEDFYGSTLTILRLPTAIETTPC